MKLEWEQRVAAATERAHAAEAAVELGAARGQLSGNQSRGRVDAAAALSRYHVPTDDPCRGRGVNASCRLVVTTQAGKSEIFMDHLGHRHFEQRKSASHRRTLLDAATASGLDADALDAFLSTDELVKEVWGSYGSTIDEKGIHAIPRRRRADDIRRVPRR